MELLSKEDFERKKLKKVCCRVRTEWLEATLNKNSLFMIDLEKTLIRFKVGMYLLGIFP